MVISDIKEFEMLLEKKRHAEIISILTKVLEGLSNIKNDSPVDVKVDVDTSNIENILKSINTQPDFSSIPNSIKAIGDVISKKLEEQKHPEPVKNWVHNITRDNNGLIAIVTSQAQ